MEEESREFRNSFPDYDGQDVWPNFLDHTKRLLQHWKHYVDLYWNDSNLQIYSGLAGGALVYLKIFEQNLSSSLGLSGEETLKKAEKIVDKCLSRHNHRHTFLAGKSGIVALKAVVCFYRKTNYKFYLEQLASFAEELKDSHELPDELLYGRVGYLYSLLFVRAKIDGANRIVEDQLIREQITLILKSGQMTARKHHPDLALAFYWHNKFYIGAAHGITGIIHVLLEARQFLTENELATLIKPSVDFILGLQFSSGNFPSSLGRNEDKLVHWCHGSPGVIHLLILAHQNFHEDKYLQAAVKAADDIWQRGLLKKGLSVFIFALYNSNNITKGHGLCHGVAGNGYAFLRLFGATNDRKQLYRAVKFAEWCTEPQTHRENTAERTVSLYEGLAGTLYFFLDLMKPSEAKFPAFQIWSHNSKTSTTSKVD